MIGTIKGLSRQKSNKGRHECTCAICRRTNRGALALTGNYFRAYQKFYSKTCDKKAYSDGLLLPFGKDIRMAMFVCVCVFEVHMERIIKRSGESFGINRVIRYSVVAE